MLTPLEAWDVAIEAAARMADSECEPTGPLPKKMEQHSKETLVRASVIATKLSIAAAIRSLTPPPEIGAVRDDDTEDMAAVGRSLMNAIASIQHEGSPYDHWAPADDPAEIVTDLFEDLRVARDEVERLKSDLTKALDAANYEANRNAQPAPPDEADIEAVIGALQQAAEGEFAGLLRDFGKLTFPEKDPDDILRRALSVVATAAIAALRGRGWRKVPDGWRVVPIKPTEAMIETGECEFRASDGACAMEPAQECWDAMLSAAPEPPA